jgi:preprotein translocase subunit SecD
MSLNFRLGWRIWILIIVLALSLLAIFGSPFSMFKKGILVTSVEPNSTAFYEGLSKGQIIKEIDGQEVGSVEEYSRIIGEKYSKGESAKTTIKTDNSEIVLFSEKAPEITVSKIPRTNIITGLDISGGSRALVKAQDVDLSLSGADDLVQVIQKRLNVYGIEDVKVSKVTDFSGNIYIGIDIAGITPDDLRNLISQQGKFEAKIGNETVFIGGKDITSVARSGQDAVVESCQQSSEGGYFCNFRFAIFLNEDAARRHASVTKNLAEDISSPGYLSEKLDLYLDDRLVDSLFISTGLKGQVTTQISISGSGAGDTVDSAQKNARAEMNNLQTILITGSLPYKLEIVKLDTISPSFGEELIRAILIAGVVSLLAVSAFIFLRYRNFKSSLALLLTSISEVVIIMGIASLIRWNLDLPSIAGILVTIGTGIDQQIIILDEAREKFLSLRQRLKAAFFIILSAYFTALVAMVPLYWAAAGFFKGFAITTIIGITAGVLITRPAFSEIVGRIERE